ncbi:MAG: hypothetical protein ACREPL_14190 [Rhodanobacteraceae bacterium]
MTMFRIVSVLCSQKFGHFFVHGIFLTSSVSLQVITEVWLPAMRSLAPNLIMIFLLVAYATCLKRLQTRVNQIIRGERGPVFLPAILVVVGIRLAHPPHPCGEAFRFSYGRRSIYT